MDYIQGFSKFIAPLNKLLKINKQINFKKIN